jgi:curved DNA-binding protein CbpA
MVTDYYKILNIPRNASQELIRKAYRSKAKMYHPDVNHREGASVDFQMISEAYQTLINSDKKKWYDFKLKYPTTTGLSQGHRSPGHKDADRYASYYAAYTRRQDTKQKETEASKYIKTKVDKVLFYFLVATGVLAIFFGTMRLVNDKWENINDLSGIIFGVWFLILLFYGWNMISK